MDALRTISIKYKAMQALYWMLYCLCYGYMTFYLAQNGFSVASIGVMSAVFGVVSSVLQVALGRLTDKAGIGWKRPLIILLAASLALSAALLVVRPPFAQGILFCILVTLCGSAMPFVNSACFFCTADGKGVDFGSARGTGSLGYALISVLTGFLLKSFDERVIPLSSALVILLLLSVTVSLPFVPGSGGHKASQSKENSAGIMQFIRSTPGFLAVWAAGVLMMVFHCMTNTYMLQIVQKAGGGSRELGVTLGIAAVMELPVMFTFSAIYRRFSSRKLFVVAGVAFGVKGLLYLFAANTLMIWLSQLFQMLSFAIYANLSVLFATENIKEEFFTISQSMMSVTISLGTVIGSLLGGFFIGTFGINAMLVAGLFIISLSLAIIACGGIFCAKR